MRDRIPKFQMHEAPLVFGQLLTSRLFVKKFYKVGMISQDRSEPVEGLVS